MEEEEEVEDDSDAEKVKESVYRVNKNERRSGRKNNR